MSQQNQRHSSAVRTSEVRSITIQSSLQPALRVYSPAEEDYDSVRNDADEDVEMAAHQRNNGDDGNNDGRAVFSWVAGGTATTSNELLGVDDVSGGGGGAAAQESSSSTNPRHHSSQKSATRQDSSLVAPSAGTGGGRLEGRRGRRRSSLLGHQTPTNDSAVAPSVLRPSSGDLAHARLCTLLSTMFYCTSSSDTRRQRRLVLALAMGQPAVYQEYIWAAALQHQQQLSTAVVAVVGEGSTSLPMATASNTSSATQVPPPASAAAIQQQKASSSTQAPVVAALDNLRLYGCVLHLVLTSIADAPIVAQTIVSRSPHTAASERRAQSVLGRRRAFASSVADEKSYLTLCNTFDAFLALFYPCSPSSATIATSESADRTAGGINISSAVSSGVVLVALDGATNEHAHRIDIAFSNVRHAWENARLILDSSGGGEGSPVGRAGPGAGARFNPAAADKRVIDAFLKATSEWAKVVLLTTNNNGPVDVSFSPVLSLVEPSTEQQPSSGTGGGAGDGEVYRTAGSPGAGDDGQEEGAAAQLVSSRVVQLEVGLFACCVTSTIAAIAAGAQSPDAAAAVYIGAAVLFIACVCFAVSMTFHKADNDRRNTNLALGCLFAAVSGELLQGHIPGGTGGGGGGGGPTPSPQPSQLSAASVRADSADPNKSSLATMGGSGSMNLMTITTTGSTGGGTRGGARGGGKDLVLPTIPAGAGGAPASATLPIPRLVEGTHDATLGSYTSKAPNPLSDVFDFEATGRTTNASGGPDDDEEGVVKVRVDPTGTFLVPFLESEPILLDGVHVHKHLAMMGIEFARGFTSSLGGTKTGGGHTSSENTTATSSFADESYEDLDEFDSEERYIICMWNEAMTNATGGFSSDATISLTLSQVVSDVRSYNSLLALIERMEADVGNPYAELPTEPLVVQMVHKDLGECRMQFTVAPVTRSSTNPATSFETDECIGALLVGVPIDPREELVAVTFHGQHLSQVAEEFLAASQGLEFYLAPQSTSTTQQQQQPSVTSSSGAGQVGVDGFTPYDVYRRVNDSGLLAVLQDLAAPKAVDDRSWEAIYSSCIAGLVSRAFTTANVTCTTDASLPGIVECNISAVTSILHVIVNALSATASASPLSKGTRIHFHFQTTAADSATMACRVSNVDSERLARKMSGELELENPATMGIVFDRLAQGNAHILFAPSSTAVNAHNGPPAPSASVLSNSRSIFSTSSGASASSGKDGGAAGQLVDTIVLFPFRVHSGVGTTWELRKMQQADQARRASGGCGPMNASAIAAHPLGQQGSASVFSAGGGVDENNNPNPKTAEDSLSAMLVEGNQLDRHKLVRLFWEGNHAVYPLDTDAFFPKGLKVMRANCNNFDVVILDVPAGKTSEADFIEELTPVCNEFSSIVFILRKQKKKRNEAANKNKRTPSPNPKTLLPPPPEAKTARDTTGDNPQDHSLLAFPVVHTHEQPGSPPAVVMPSVAPAPALPPNLHIIVKSHGHDSLVELIDYASKHVGIMRERMAKKQNLQELFRLHRTSPWEKGKKLGRGTFGDVYEAIMTLTGGKMAVKVIRLPSSDTGRLESLANEIEVLTKVQHPNIVRYFYCEMGSPGEVNIFMELCNGGSLQSRILSGHKFEVEELSALLQQCLSAVSYLHEKGFVHRDIKPANILLSDGKVKLADFGTAAAVANASLRDVAGTFAYMAPEVFAGEDHSTPCDVWSIGCVTLEMLGRSLCRSVIGGEVSGPAAISCYFNDCKSDAEIWSRLAIIESPLLISFLQSCFRLRPADRSTADELLLHPLLLDQRKSVGLVRKSSVSSSLTGGLAGARSAGGGGAVSLADSRGALSICSDDYSQSQASGGGKDNNTNTSTSNESPDFFTSRNKGEKNSVFAPTFAAKRASMTSLRPRHTLESPSARAKKVRVSAQRVGSGVFTTSTTKQLATTAASSPPPQQQQRPHVPANSSNDDPAHADLVLSDLQ